MRPKWIATVLALTLLTPAAPAHAETGETIAPGVTYRTVEWDTPRGTVLGHLIVADLGHPKVRTDLITAGAVAARAPISQQVTATGAIAGVNADFFNISNTQPGVEVTGAAAGPAIAGGRDLKGAVPQSQRFGPSFPPGGSIQDVIGVGVDKRARTARLSLQGRAFGPHTGFPVDGLNQYAIKENGIGAYTADWGTPSRKRATCGSDTSRSAPCAARTHEVTITRGEVSASTTEPGSGPIADGQTVLVGREAGADLLAALKPGDRVQVSYRLSDDTVDVPFQFAAGGFPVLRGGQPLEGVNPTVAAIRTGAGFSADGRTLMLVALSGSLTLLELAEMLRDLGAWEAFNLDGGGSTTMVTRVEGSEPLVRAPSGGAERPVPNGIGIFTK